jgi:carbon monoxide dehydrogenase subunit G
MDIKNSFTVPLPVEETWKILLDIRRIAPCMPGAELLEVIDDKTFKGKVSVRLGPVALSFVGTARFEEIDAAAHRARLKGQGTDSKGRGGATGVVTLALSPVGGGTNVDVNTSVNLTGAVAQYGRGAGMIQGVATEIIGQFAASLNAMLQHDSTVAAVAGNPAAGASAATLRPPAKPISGFTLMARILWNSVRRLFGRS